MRRRWRRRGRDELGCHDVARVVQHYLDGELDQRTAREVAAHLDDCHRCGLEASTYRELKQRLSGLAGPVDQAALGRLRAFVDELTEHAGR